MEDGGRGTGILIVAVKVYASQRYFWRAELKTYLSDGGVRSADHADGVRLHECPRREQVHVGRVLVAEAAKTSRAEKESGKIYRGTKPNFKAYAKM